MNEEEIEEAEEGEEKGFENPYEQMKNLQSQLKDHFNRSLEMSEEEKELDTKQQLKKLNSYEKILPNFDPVAVVEFAEKRGFGSDWVGAYSQLRGKPLDTAEIRSLVKVRLNE